MNLTGRSGGGLLVDSAVQLVLDSDEENITLYKDGIFIVFFINFNNAGIEIGIAQIGVLLGINMNHFSCFGPRDGIF